MDICIIKTLSYFDIFDYPLTFQELKKYLCCKLDLGDDEFLEIIYSIPTIQESNGLFYFLGRKDIVEKREERGQISITKHAKARVIAKILTLVPTVEYIGISGSLSMNNASISDDIDFFIVTKKNSLWITRLVVNVLLLLVRQKRKRGSKIYADKICPNMFVEENGLVFGGKRKTIYTAHEIVQMKTIFDRHNIHQKILAKNKWIKKFIPATYIGKTKNRNISLLEKLACIFLIPFEKAAYVLQTFYMRKRRVRELTTKSRAFFHPKDRQKLILDMHRLRYLRYKKIHEDNLWINNEEAIFYIDQKKIRILN